MKKSGFWTLVFACVPGAGQMYQGYMKRGLSAVLVFCGLIWGTTVVSSLIIFAMVAYMYSFFDTFNLRAQIMAGSAPADDYLFEMPKNDWLAGLWQNGRHKLLGWALILVGVYSLYQRLVRGLYEVLHQYELYWLYNMLDSAPRMFVYLVLIGAGMWLVRGPRPAKAAPAPDAEDRHYGEGAQDNG